MQQRPPLTPYGTHMHTAYAGVHTRMCIHTQRHATYTVHTQVCTHARRGGSFIGSGRLQQQAPTPLPPAQHPSERGPFPRSPVLGRHQCRCCWHAFGLTDQQGQLLLRQRCAQWVFPPGAPSLQAFLPAALLTAASAQGMASTCCRMAQRLPMLFLMAPPDGGCTPSPCTASKHLPCQTAAVFPHRRTGHARGEHTKHRQRGLGVCLFNTRSSHHAAHPGAAQDANNRKEEVHPPWQYNPQGGTTLPHCTTAT